MATSSPSPSSQPLDANTEKPEIQNPSINHPDSGFASENPKPIPNTVPSPVIPPPPAAPSFTAAFRPLGAPTALQYPAFSNPGYPPPPMVQNPGIQPPGVAASGAGAVPASVPPMRPGMYPCPPGQAPVVYGPGPNGYMAVPPPAPLAPGVMPPPGIPRYPGPYPLVRAGFPPRPGFISPLARPPIPGIRGIPPIVTPVVRPPITIVAPQEKPQTTVYVGKIAPTVDNDFLLSLLRLCGPVKSWKRAQDPTDGTPKGFGFCEFESAEGVLRALRLLSKLSIDGQELVLNIKQATREYLDRYIEKKLESEKLKGPESEIATEENKSAAAVENKDPQNPKPVGETKEDLDTSKDKENQESTQKFGIITDEDRDADREILEKVTSMIEERIKTKPLPPPPPVQVPVDAKSNSEVPSKSRDGDSGVDVVKGDVDNRNDDETTSEMKSAAELEKLEASSADKGSRHDRRGRERDRDLKREKERELERYERERERERVRRERERDIKSREVERLYNERLKEWEAREREKERQRKYEKDREKEREWERRKLVMKQEDESDDEDIRRRRYRSSMYEEKRRKRKREKEDDSADRLKEVEEIAEAKRRAIEAQEKINSIELSAQVSDDVEKVATQDEGMVIDGMENVEEDSHQGDGIDKIGCNDEQVGSATGSDTKQNSHVPTRKLGFGLVGSGKRAAMPSVFHEADDEDVEERKMRPLVPIDYSTDEIQAIQNATSAAQPNLVAAAEFAKRISSVNHKEEKLDVDKERNKRTSDRERGRSDDGNSRLRDESKERIHKVHDRERDQEDKLKENRKLLDAKQLIDMIPKTKDELFAYQINWDVYDKHKLHERMRPWIAKKITEFLGEEEDTLVDYIVSNTKEHAQASKMLELLQSILDDEAEMFVLKMWRMLIFEIKKVETGLTVKPRG
ncbi:putative RNA recognition motif domain, PWI domain, RNA-binding domain superfamily [Dioscorea sansibarensis]